MAEQSCYLNDLRNQNQLCDITINVSGRAFHVHRTVLAAFSSYFMAMFTSGFRESSESEINIDGDPDIWEILLEFVYTGNLNITAETSYGIFEMACYMQLKDACEYAATFVTNNIDKISIIDVHKICQITQPHDYLRDLTSFLEIYLCRHVEELTKSQVFLEMASADFLIRFLKCEELSSEDEEIEVLRMVVSWLKHDWKNRRPHAPSLLREVRLGHVTQQSLTEVLGEEILKIPECKKLFEEACEGHKSGISKFKLSKKIPHLFCPRSIITAPVTVIKDEEDVYFHFYDAREKRWIKLCRFGFLPIETSTVPSLIVIEGILYAVGGLQEACGADLNNASCCGYEGISPWLTFGDSVCQYDAEENTWNRLPDTKVSRDQVLLVHLDGFIYAIAGKIPSRGLCDVERYVINKRKWTTQASLPDSYHWKSAVTCKGKILVNGVSKQGFRKNIEVMQDFQKHVFAVYDCTIDTWHILLTEDIEKLDQDYSNHCIDPVLLHHKEMLYRVCYQSTSPKDWDEASFQPVVNKLNIQGNVNEITLGENIKQDMIPVYKEGFVCIDNEVCIMVKGSVIQTGLITAADQSTKVNLNWVNTYLPGEHSNVTHFTFDRKRYTSGNPQN